MDEASKPFSFSEPFRFGWEAFKREHWKLIAVLLIPIIISAVFNGISKELAHAPLLSLLASIISVIVGIFLQLGILCIMLDVVDGGSVRFKRLFGESGKILPYLGSTIIYGIAVAAGLILFIIPGVYFMIKYQFYGYLIVDRGLGPIQALKESGHITDSMKWDILLFGVLTFLVTIAGALALFVGLLITMPVTSIAYAYLYRMLAKRRGDTSSVPEPVIPEKVVAMPAETKG